MSDAIRAAIEAADVVGLRTLVAKDASLADADVVWGEGGRNVVPPLHFVCDAVFRGLASEDQARAMADVLLDAGVDPRRAYAKSGDTFLITAASLGAQSVGLRLVELGVDLTRRGLFGATALHWAAFMGLDGLALALVKGDAELDLADTRYGGTSLHWALQGWTRGTSPHRDRIPRVVSLLVEHGARIPVDMLDSLADDGNVAMREALQARPLP